MLGFLYTLFPIRMSTVQRVISWGKNIIIDGILLIQISWINHYHSECLDKVGSYLGDSGKTEILKWLERETQPLG